MSVTYSAVRCQCGARVCRAYVLAGSDGSVTSLNTQKTATRIAELFNAAEQHGGVAAFVEKTRRGDRLMCVSVADEPDVETSLPRVS